MIDLAVSGRAIARSRRSITLPVRQMTRVPRRSGNRVRMASSISTLSRSARITTAALRSLSLAIDSSESTVKTRSDQPSTSVWPVSSTGERPLRSSPRRWSTAVAITPMKALKMMMPANVSVSWRAMKSAFEVSSAVTVPASMTCSSAL